MPQQAPFINPLALIGRNNPAPVDNSALQKLMASGAIQKLANQGALERTELTNTGAFDLKALGLGLPSPGSPNFDVDRARFGKSLEFERNLGASAKGRRAGLSPTIPEGGIQVQDLPGAKINLSKFPGVLQAQAVSEAELKKSQQIQDKELLLPGNVPVGIKQRTTTRGSESKVKQRNTPRAREASNSALDKDRIARARKFLETKFPGKDIKGPTINPLDGTLEALIDGKRVTLN